MVTVTVYHDNIEQAMRAFKKKIQREGIFREMKLRRYYEKPSERRKRKIAESKRRVKKLQRRKSSDI